jgi:hypothetical protein
MLRSPFKDDAIRFGGASEADLKRLSAAWGRFGTTADALIVVMFSEMVATKSE